MPSAERATRPGVSLRAKLAAASGAVAIAMAAFLVLWFGPRTEDTFAGHSNALIARTAAAMDGLVRENTAASAVIVRDVAHHLADARRRALEDLPLSLYGGDVERIRAAIVAQDDNRTARLGRNLGVLSAEMQRRAAAKVDAHVALLGAEQAASSAAFGASLRWSALAVVGGVLLAMLAVLAFGLDRLVASPLRALRQATHAVANGQLDVAVRARSRDEVGALADDFVRMVERLRATRAEIETEVARKTAHLEGALADLRRAQQQLVLADRMAAIGTLAGGIAHEFNNLIGGIRGCVREALQADGAPERRESLEVALRATDRARDIADKLLRFARPRVQGRAPVALARLVGEVLDLVEPEARRLGVSTENRIPADLTAAVDAAAMHQVFLNLFTNALQAMPSGGRLGVTAAAHGAGIVIDVTDTGHGIPEHEIQHVFDPFHTTKDTASDPFQRGTGLGLSVSYGIVEAHGGAIRVRSRIGAGTTFAIELPGDGASDA